MDNSKRFPRKNMLVR